MPQVLDTFTNTQASVSVGDWVCFKSDIEQSGLIVAIGHNEELCLENESGFSGGYIGGQTSTMVFASDCWV